MTKEVLVPVVHAKFVEDSDFLRIDALGDQAWNDMIPCC
jgi:hypothetical protein